MATIMRTIALLIAITALACANRPGPFCLSGVTTYVEGAKGVTRERSLYGDSRSMDRARGRTRGAEIRAGVALEWDPNRGACEGDSDSQ